jgi:WD40 repeat protein
MLTVWDWENERIILHSKAFGQDVFSAKFSLEDEGHLTTCGTGHIRFWKMASTFTGQKLQGLIGKFGKVELSDIAAFVELPDGKVLSGTESGALLLWEGNFIKSRIIQPSGRLCHDGEVSFLALDRIENCIISAGVDGYLRFWDFKEVDTSEPQGDNSVDVYVRPLAEYRVGNTGIKALVDTGRVGSDRYFVILDTRGRFLRLSLKFSEESTSLISVILTLATETSGIPRVEMLDSFHAGAITGLDTSPSGHVAVTCGEDGQVKCWDYVNKELLQSQDFSTAATCLRWVPLSIDPSGRSFVVGFADGIIRRMAVGLSVAHEKVILLLKAYKPHNASVTDVGFSSPHKLMFTSGKDGIIFVFKCQPGAAIPVVDSWTPLFFVSIATNLKGVFSERLSVHPKDIKIVCSCTDGIVREVDLDAMNSQASEANQDVQSYEKVFPTKDFSIQIASFSPLLKSVEVEVAADSLEVIEIKEEGKQPEASNGYAPKLQAATYAVTGHPVQILASTNHEISQVFECTLMLDRPLKEVTFGNYSTDGKLSDKAPLVKTMGYSNSHKLFYTGAADGSVTVRHVEYSQVYLRLHGHSSSTGGVSAVVGSFDDAFLLSAGLDGILVVHRLEINFLVESSLLLLADLEVGAFGEAVSKPFTTRMHAPIFVHIVSTLDEPPAAFPVVEPFKFTSAEVVAAPALAEVDIDSHAYSIQDAKLKSEMDGKRQVAEGLKGGLREAVAALRDEFDWIVKQNAKIPSEVRLSDKELEIDCEYFKYLSDQGEAMVQEVHKECAYDLEKSKALSLKLQARLMENLLVEKMPLKSLDPKKKCIVFSLRVREVDVRVREMLGSVGEMVRSDQLEEVKRSTALAADRKRIKALDDMHKRVQQNAGSNAQNEEKDDKRSLTSAERAKAARKKRRAELEKHLAERPDEKEDDPRDVEEILSAESTLGDYKLKCADEYEVPEDQRINAAQKQRQIALLEESTVIMRLSFNQRFLSTRQLKRQMIINICNDNARIRAINSELKEEHLSTSLWEPRVDPLEYPDDRFEVTEEELKEYATTRLSTSWKDAKAPINQTITGAKTYIYCDPMTSKWSVTENPTPATEGLQLEDDETEGMFAANKIVLSSFLPARSTVEAKRIAALEEVVPCLMLAKASIRHFTSGAHEDTAHRQLMEDRRRALAYERKILLEKTAADIEYFDRYLDELRVDRHLVISNLKLAELKLLALYQEYELLKTFDGRDKFLSDKFADAQQEKIKILAVMTDENAKLNVKSEEWNRRNDEIQRISVEFKLIIPDTNPSSEMLGKIFRKKVRRARGNDTEDEDDDYDDDENFDEEEEEVDDVCPPGCDAETLDEVIKLRARRAGEEELLAEVQKGIDASKKITTQLKRREQATDTLLKSTSTEIQQFQQQKQAALNKIDIYVPITISQLYTFETSGLLSGPREVDMSTLTKEDAMDYTMFESVEIDDSLASLLNESKTMVSGMTMQSHVLIKRQ